MQEKRNLHRIPNKFGSDLIAYLHIGSAQFRCTIRDYNTRSVAIKMTDELFTNLLEENRIELVELKFGKEVICIVKNPICIKIDKPTMSLVLILQTSDKMLNPKREYRSKIPLGLIGSCIGPDPLKVSQLLNFKIIDISSEGFLLKSSKTNRHLMTGVKLENFEFILPGAGVIKASAIIKHADVNETDIIFGCQFLDVSPKHARIINGYYFICTNSINPEEAPYIAQSKVLFLRDFVRIERVSSPIMLEEVLKVRYESYKLANKLSSEVTSPQEMYDEYDKNSIILAAFLGSKIVGTLRLVFSENESKFPFEENFDFPSHVARDNVVEVSKLAILPSYQGSDILIKLFQGFAFECSSKKDYSICMATKKLSKYYLAIGAKAFSKPIPHPTIKDETLTCYLFNKKAFVTGKMRAIAWYAFAEGAVDTLAKFGFAKKVRYSVRLPLLRIVENIFLKLKKK